MLIGSSGRIINVVDPLVALLDVRPGLVLLRKFGPERALFVTGEIETQWYYENRLGSEAVW
jgi:hypothetical protein